jgi:hypothetical protein
MLKFERGTPIAVVPMTAHPYADVVVGFFEEFENTADIILTLSGAVSFSSYYWRYMMSPSEGWYPDPVKDERVSREGRVHIFLKDQVRLVPCPNNPQIQAVLDENR